MVEKSGLKRIAVDARPLSDPLSGVSRVISRILLNFPDRENYQFLLYSNRGWHSDFDDVVSLPNVIWLQGKGFTARKAGLWFNLTLPALIRRSRPEADLFWGTQQVIPPMLPSKMPVVLTFHDLVLYFYPQAMRFLARVQQRIFQRYSVARADLILSNSRQTQEDMVKLFQYPQEKARVSLLGYDPPPRNRSSTKESDSKNGTLRIQNRILKTPFILSVSTIEPRKNYSTLIDGYRRYHARESGKPYPLVIAGRRGWESESFYRELSEVQRVTGSVHVVEGATDEEIQLLYKNCAFFAIASIYEGFGLPLLESLCHGKHAIASDIGSFREIGGYLVHYTPPNDPDAWSRSLEEMVNRHRNRDLKKIDFPVDEWGWVRTAKIHHQAFEDLIRVKGRSEERDLSDEGQSGKG